jgi:hypothetical protein
LRPPPSQCVRILVDRERERAAGKRGGKLARHDLDFIHVAAPEPAADPIAVDEALARFEVVDPFRPNRHELIRAR